MPLAQKQFEWSLSSKYLQSVAEQYRNYSSYIEGMVTRRLHNSDRIIPSLDGEILPQR